MRNISLRLVILRQIDRRQPRNGIRFGIAEGAKGGEYTSIENFQARTGANSAVIKALTEAGCLNGLPETDQLCLF